MCVCKCLQGFKATFQRPGLTAGELSAALAAPEVPFSMLTVGELVPAGWREMYCEAGGEVIL